MVEKNGAWWIIRKSNPNQKVLSVFSATRPDVYICKHNGQMPVGEFVVDFDSSGKSIQRLRPSTAPKTTRRTTTRMPLRNDEETTSTTTTEFQSTESTTTTTSMFSTIDFGNVMISSSTSSSPAEGRRIFSTFRFNCSMNPEYSNNDIHTKHSLSKCSSSTWC